MGAMAATSVPFPKADACPTRYRPRNPRLSSLYQLLESHYETVKSVWEDRFERRYGFWRGLCDTAVARYLDCGLFESTHCCSHYRSPPPRVNSAPASRRPRIECPVLYPFTLRPWFLPDDPLAPPPFHPNNRDVSTRPSTSFALPGSWPPSLIPNARASSRLCAYPSPCGL